MTIDVGMQACMLGPEGCHIMLVRSVIKSVWSGLACFLPFRAQFNHHVGKHQCTQPTVSLCDPCRAYVSIKLHDILFS